MSESESLKKTRTAKAAGVDAKLARQGGLSYLEIPATNANSSAKFYAKVAGWKVREQKGEACRFSDPSGHLIGRFVAGRRISKWPGLLPYIYVRSIRQAVAQVARCGGGIVKGPYREGNLWVAVVRDPAGNMIGLWQAAGR
jgi:predicted enzyme related to lactoylglutathione lyase